MLTDAEDTRIIHKYVDPTLPLNDSADSLLNILLIHHVKHKFLNIFVLESVHRGKPPSCGVHLAAAGCILLAAGNAQG